MTEDVDNYYCPGCGFEWGGYGHPPPLAECPSCYEYIMRQGTPEDDDDDSDVEPFEKQPLDEDQYDVFVINHDDFWSLHSDSSEELYDTENIYYSTEDMRNLYELLKGHFESGAQ